MLKIVELHTSKSAQGEYVVLQNQGLITVSLRGWAVCTEAYLDGNIRDMAEEMFIFREDIAIKPYTYVVLFSGTGSDDWEPTVDGRQAYYAYWNRRCAVWGKASHVHILQITASRRVNSPVMPIMPVTA